MASSAAIFRSSPTLSSPVLHRSANKCPTPSVTSASTPLYAAFCMNGAQLQYSKRKNSSRVITKVSTVAEPVVEEEIECSLPTWAEFDLGKAPVFWKTMNGLPPTSGEQLTLFYNPAASKIIPNEEFGIAFNGGFNQPIMCGGEPREMRRKNRGKADPPFYSIRLRIPRHAVNLIFSFTNGTDWDGPYRLKFQPLKNWRNKTLSFFNEGLAEELSKDGACERAIYLDSNIVVSRCAMIGNLTAEGGDRCKLDLVLGCTDPSSASFNPLANVDDGSCPLDMEADEA